MQSDGAAGSQRDVLCDCRHPREERSCARGEDGWRSTCPRAPVRLRRPQHSGLRHRSDRYGENKEVSSVGLPTGHHFEIGLFALSSGDILDDAKRAAYGLHLDVETAEVMRLNPDGTLRLEAGGNGGSARDDLSPPRMSRPVHDRLCAVGQRPGGHRGLCHGESVHGPGRVLRAGMQSGVGHGHSRPRRAVRFPRGAYHPKTHFHETTSISSSPWSTCSPRP
jgi:hypothetical protein